MPTYRGSAQSRRVRVYLMFAIVLALAAPAHTAHASTALASGVGTPESVLPARISVNAAMALRAKLRDGTFAQTHSSNDICAGLHCLAWVATVSRQSQQPLASSVPVGYSPAELAVAYHLPDVNLGSTGAIAVLSTGADPNLESDLAVYRKQFGLPACTAASGCFRQMDYRGGPAQQPTTKDELKVAEQIAAQETSADVEMASAACPRCSILEVQAPLADIQYSTPEDKAVADFGRAAITAVKSGAKTVSVSFGYDPDTYADFGQPARDFFHPGVPVTAASGDAGYNGSQHEYWPENLPSVTSVGGTSLYPANRAGTSYHQVAWDRAGSGCETDFAAAYGQPSSITKRCRGHRASSDVSVVGDPQTGIAWYDSYHPAEPGDTGDYNWGVIGGTSIGAPYLAGLYARSTNLSDVIGPNTLYASPRTAFTDVTLGDNAAPNTCQQDVVDVSVCEASPGWDGPTGLGTPRGLTAFGKAQP